VLARLVLGVPPDRDEGVQPAHYFFYQPIRHILLRDNALGLKNIGATYQHCMQWCLNSLIEEVVEVYIDNIVVKSKKANHLVENLEQTFARL
jgi:hypothetical protein